MRMNKRNNRGFTLAELMVVVGIIAILAVISALGIGGYRRALRRMEANNNAREIFVAAQNHLSMARSQGRLTDKTGSDLGTQETSGAFNGADEGSYYFVVNSATYPANNGSRVLDLVLPFGSVDDTVRRGGSYVVRYQKSTFTVQDVFWTEDAWLMTDSLYQTLMSVVYADGGQPVNDPEAALKTYVKENGLSAPVGYYGGAKLAELTKGARLKAPAIEVINAEKLVVKVANPNTGVGEASLKLIITGRTSGAKTEIELIGTGGSPVNFSDSNNIIDQKNSFTVVLDDVTDSSGSNRHFAAVCADLIPGEDITVQAMAYNNAQLSNITYSSEVTTNSLYAAVTQELRTGGTEQVTTAQITNFRHFENLMGVVSGVGSVPAGSGLTAVTVKQAHQMGDMDWAQFIDATKGAGSNIRITGKGGEMLIPAVESGKSFLLPVDLTDLHYIGWDDTDGANGLATMRLIRGVNVKMSSGPAGVFGTVNRDSRVEGVAAVGGSVISSDGIAGGLAGVLNGTVRYCAAANLVKGKTAAGGLVGLAGTDAVLADCQTGGHTLNTAAASYFDENGSKTADRTDDRLNVVADSGSAGGLAGVSYVNITNCYSTCSASGSYAGGLVGSGSGSIMGCYATGLVKGTYRGAVAGVTGLTLNSVYYLSGVNGPLVLADRVRTGENDSVTDPAGVAPIDKDLATYRAMAVASGDAVMRFNTKLPAKYDFKTVKALNSLAPDWMNAHYGDWPIPDALLVNIPTT